MEAPSEYNYKKISEKIKHIDNEKYQYIHENTVICCHDIFVKINGKYLLIKRKQEPAKNLYYSIGGRLIKNTPITQSIKNKVKEEANLDIKKLKFVGVARTTYKDAPFNHGKGTDTFNIIYSAEGEGEIKINDKHSKHVLVSGREIDKLKEEKKIDSYIYDCLKKIDGKDGSN